MAMTIDDNGRDCHKQPYSFNYIYNCDIEDYKFRVKIHNLDGISPPSSEEEKSNLSSIQNHYSYNIVDMLEELKLINDIVSSDEEDEEDCVDEKSHSNEPEARRASPVIDTNVPTFLSDLKKAEQKRRRKHKKLSDLIYGGLNKPFRALSSHPVITIDLVANNERLCPPQEVPYRQMEKRYEWNEWVMFSLPLESLPRDAKVCFTIWDTLGPGRMAAVARTSISLFSKYGCMRKGLYDLRLFFNEDCNNLPPNDGGDDSMGAVGGPQLEQDLKTEVTMNELCFTQRQHKNKSLVVNKENYASFGLKQVKGGGGGEGANGNVSLKLAALERLKSIDKKQASKKAAGPSSADLESIKFANYAQYLQSDLSNYPDGNRGLCKIVKQLNKLKKKYKNGQMTRVEFLDRLTFVKIEQIIVQEKGRSTLAYLAVEFPGVRVNEVDHAVVYYEDREDCNCSMLLELEKNRVSQIYEPEKNSVKNLVELKHHKLARSARSGISDRDLKPNAVIRDQLHTIVNYPLTRVLTSEDQDLVWKFRFYLCSQKKALTKFLKIVKWEVSAEVEQAIALMRQWAPMDVEDALELLSPQFKHRVVRRYAVSRLKEASDEDLSLYLLQLVQALKYENFEEIKFSFNKELEEYTRQQERHQQQGGHADAASSRSERRSFQENPPPPGEAMLVESIKIFSTTNTSDLAEGRSLIGPASSSMRRERQSSIGTIADAPLPEKDESTQESDSTSTTKQDSILDKYDEDLATFLIRRASANDSLANYFFWYLAVECEGHKSFAGSASGKSGGSAMITEASLATTTPEKTTDNSNAGSVVNEMYMTMMKRFSTRLLLGTTEMVARRRFLQRQQEFVISLVRIMDDVASENGNRTKKIEKLQTILASQQARHRFSFSARDPLPLPLDPEVKIVDVVASEATLFKSAMMPAKLAFRLSDGSVYYTIFKHGDDLRQDDLVLQMIILMDKLLRMENLDLKLTPYRVLACNSKHGFVQYIDSLSVAEVISNENSIQNYLRKISAQPMASSLLNSGSMMINSEFQVVTSVPPKPIPTESPGVGGVTSSPTSSGTISTASSNTNLSAMSISPEIMENYVKSCAGYCVITYLLGVGDRHLDNLLLTKTGRLFHIDFGFILGRDPKVRPPPMKMTREMVDTMGGMNSENFFKFCVMVRTAFLHLRRHANLILNLFSLMVDANVPDIALEPDKTVQKVQDKFKLELNDEQAMQHIMECIEQSVRAIMPLFVDQFHKMAQYFRN